MALNVYKGVGVHFGVGSSNVGSYFGSMTVNVREHSFRGTVQYFQNWEGNTTQGVFSDPYEEATFTYIPTTTSGGSAPITVPTFGSFLTITDTIHTAIAHTCWIVEDVDIQSSNTAATRVVVKLKYYPLITS